MNIQEIDTLIFDMNTVEKSHLLHYLLGYAKSDPKFRNKFVESINERELHTKQHEEEVSELKGENDKLDDGGSLMEYIENIRIFKSPQNFKDGEDIGPGLSIIMNPMPDSEEDLTLIGDAIRAAIQEVNRGK